MRRNSDAPLIVGGGMPVGKAFYLLKPTHPLIAAGDYESTGQSRDEDVGEPMIALLAWEAIHTLKPASHHNW